MAQRVGLTKNISELVRHFILYIYFTIITHTFYYFYVYSLCNPNRFLYSILLIHVPTPIPADESMKDETPRTGILNFTHMTFSSRFIFYMPPYKLFSTARSYSSSVIKIFLHHRIFYRYNFTHASPIFCSKNLHLHLYFLGSHLYIYKCFFILRFIIYNIFSQAYIVQTTPGHHTIIFHTTIFI